MWASGRRKEALHAIHAIGAMASESSEETFGIISMYKDFGMVILRLDVADGAPDPSLHEHEDVAHASSHDRQSGTIRIKSRGNGRFRGLAAAQKNTGQKPTDGPSRIERLQLILCDVPTRQAGRARGTQGGSLFQPYCQEGGLCQYVRLT